MPNTTILQEIITANINNQVVNVREILTRCNLDDYTGFSKITSFILDKRMATKSELNDLIQREKVSRFFQAPYPENPMEFVQIWTRHYDLRMDFKGNISSTSFRTDRVKNLYVSLGKINDKMNDEKNPIEIKNFLCEKRLLVDQIKSCEIRPSFDVIIRKIKISRDTFKLKFTDSQLVDSMEEWADTYKSSRRGDIFSQIIYLEDAQLNAKAENDLENLCSTLFDQSQLSIVAQKNILKKFIWQVKRKIKGDYVTNHIMPVFTGAQGTGKSTFMYKFIEPVSELSSPTDFKQLTDDRNISLFANSVLILDEMGFAQKAEIETVKSIMTANELTRRPMRQNSSVLIKQNATLIGASNKEIDQLIRDETGLRRFIGIRFKNSPEWDNIKDVDFYNIWRSVDEDSEDPTINSIEEIRTVQEMARCNTPCEMWVKTLKKKDSEKKTATNWYSQYKIWENAHFSKKGMDYDTWCKELRRLIITSKNYPFEYSMNGTTSYFTFEFQE